ncbi:multidrug efflux SMR transporter [Gemmobacter sp. LW-1]|uniref:DMT family transporter n=1 Tax=Gemmobacter sp. LW-1 TaxID=1529005 RepID=UPI0006C75591|nr:multidrug efflux SMR transporter [Gemmobacter sp. LW-1]OJY32115.1 MAG: QacE family quaternary ammonium compound efflux SMR transporter [Rhodobacterales bacterium 65-51]
MTLPATYAILGFAIALEVIGTSLLNATQQFTRPLPTIIMALCYGVSFYCLSLAVRVLPVGIVYAIWSGMGIVLIAAVSVIFLRQSLDFWALTGLGLIIAGVAVINLMSKSLPH